MSWGTCYSGSNNIHFDYPAMMSDGRNYTSYDPACERNERLVEAKGIKTNYQYRQYLINNAKSIQKQDKAAACDQCGVCTYGYPYQQGDHGRYLFKSCRDGTQPYGYETSDLKNEYLSRQALQSRLSAPLLSQQGYLALPRSK